MLPNRIARCISRHNRDREKEREAPQPPERAGTADGTLECSRAAPCPGGRGRMYPNISLIEPDRYVEQCQANISKVHETPSMEDLLGEVF